MIFYRAPFCKKITFFRLIFIHLYFIYAWIIRKYSHGLLSLTWMNLLFLSAYICVWFRNFGWDIRSCCESRFCLRILIIKKVLSSSSSNCIRRVLSFQKLWRTVHYFFRLFFRQFMAPQLILNNCLKFFKGQYFLLIDPYSYILQLSFISSNLK